MRELTKEQKQMLARWAGTKQSHLDLIKFVEGICADALKGMYSAEQVEAIMEDSDNFPESDGW